MQNSKTKSVCGLFSMLLLVCSPLALGFVGTSTEVPTGSYTVSKPATSKGVCVKSVEKITVYFSPNGGTEGAYVDAIGDAKKSIRGEAYSFTSRPIAEALIAAKKRGVDVQLVVDPSGASKTARGAECVKAGIPVFVDHKHAIMHAKVLILDGAKVATGSFNLSAAAENSNAENALVIECAPLAEIYLQNWESHHSHSDPLK